MTLSLGPASPGCSMWPSSASAVAADSAVASSGLENFSAGGVVSCESRQLRMISTSSWPALSCCSGPDTQLDPASGPPPSGENSDNTLSISFSSFNHVKMFCLFSIPSTQVMSLRRRSMTAEVARWVRSSSVNFGLDLMYSMTWRQVYW